MRKISPIWRQPWPATKKLLEPSGYQESSEPAHSAGPVQANSIAFDIFFIKKLPSPGSPKQQSPSPPRASP